MAAKKQSNESKTMILIENRVGRVKLNDAVTPWSADELIGEIEKTYGQKAVAENMVVGGFTAKADDALETLEIEINSPGGSVLDGYRVYNALMQMRNRGVKVVATVNTLAASMGSVILMAADTVKIVQGGRIMIHEASQTVAGDSEDHARAAKNLDEISDEIAAIYASKTGAGKEEMRELMKKETWMGAGEAIKRGFADEFVTFDTPEEAMSILAKLFPGNDQIAQLEASVAENETLRAEFAEAQTKIEEFKSLAEANAVLQDEVNDAQAKIKESEEKIAEQNETIAKLNEKIEESTNLAEVKAAEVLAAQGHPQPVALTDDNQFKPSLIEQFAALSGEEATKFFNENREAILADHNRYKI
jgi:ATP-dependent Clp endopeptidase proteolytic subunit ClpP